MVEHTIMLALCIVGLVGGALLAEHCLRDNASLPTPLAILNGIGAAAGMVLCIIFMPMLVKLIVDLFTGNVGS